MMTNTQKYKVWLFIASYTVFSTINLLFNLSGDPKTTMAMIATNSAIGRLISPMSRTSIIVFCGVCFVLTMAMNRRQTFRYGRPVRFFMLGVFLWISWGVFISVGGLAMFTNTAGYMILIRICIVVLSIFMTLKIACTYDLIIYLVGIRVAILGTLMLFAYITHFNGLDFLSSITSVLSATERYRVSFGFNHVNTTGRICLEFLMLKALYICLLKERIGDKHKVNALVKYLRVLQPIVIIMLLSCASRTSISGIVLFWFVYFYLRVYIKTSSIVKAMFGLSGLLICFILIIVVDWAELWKVFTVYSLRIVNYTTTLPILSEKSTWLAGLGFPFIDGLSRFRSTKVLDSFYLWTLLESGIVGFVLLIGTIYCFSFMYVRDMRYMTKFDRLTGGLLAVLLYYGLFESKMFGKDASDILNWLLVLTAANNMSARKVEAIHAAREARRRKKSVKPHEVRLNLLHNS